jgi:hypothetical protein
MYWEGGETLLPLDCFLIAFVGPPLPPARPHLQPGGAVVLVDKEKSSSASVSAFLEFADADLLRRESLD